LLCTKWQVYAYGCQWLYGIITKEYNESMLTKKLAPGTVHKLPKDFEKALLKSKPARDLWEDITPLARNEWICLVDSAKQDETRIRRTKRAIDQLSRGQRRPCCWAGCIHREKNGR
jgi:Bacteriocin-protection, YdeI or OmpD-Associated